MTTSCLVYQLVEPASSPSPQMGCGHHLLPIGVSITSPSTHGFPAQSFQFSSEHSAQTQLGPVNAPTMHRTIL